MPLMENRLLPSTSRLLPSTSRLLTPTTSHCELASLLRGPVPTPHLLRVHARVFRLGAHQSDLIATRLIGLHRPCLALRILALLRHPNIFPFNAAVRVLSESPSHPSALSVFRSLKARSLLPNAFTFSFLLKACFRCGDARVLHQVHNHIFKSGLDTNGMVCDGLLLAYAKGLGDVWSARNLFDEMSDRGDSTCWTCLIAGYVRLDMPEEALMLFMRMVDENVPPGDDTMVSVLSACSRIKEVNEWLHEFDESEKKADGLCRDSLDCVCVYLYGKLGRVDEACGIFDRMFSRGRGRVSVIAWNSLISSYVQNGFPIKALDVFKRMLSATYPRPNHVTIVSVVSACSQVGDLDLGRWARSYMEAGVCRGVLALNNILATAFVDMFSKCGSLKEAEDIFNGCVKKDIVIFNAMILGLAVNGHGQRAIKLFYEIKRSGLHPNGDTFLGLLSACAHCGLIAEGRALFSEMCEIFLIKPKVEHYSCYVDILSRSGHVNEALEIIRKMPCNPNEQIWGTLLRACQLHSKIDIVQYAAVKLISEDPRNSGAYVTLSNAYAADFQWGEIADLRGLMKERGLRKQPGCSWISVDGVMHEFLAGASTHLHMQDIHLVLSCLHGEMIVKLAKG